MCFGAMTTRFFLPTNWRLILELPTYFEKCGPFRTSGTTQATKEINIPEALNPQKEQLLDLKLF